jgi:phosphate starvation-inducible protein PhoH
MPARKKTTKAPGEGMTAKQRKRRKPISEDYMLPIEPLTDNQKVMFDAWDEGKMIYAYGVAGTGKTFVALYKALKDVLNEYTPYEKIYIVRSLVATREIGFLPGDHEDKSSLYQIPYKNMVQSMFEMPDDNSYEMLYDNLKAQETISFWSTSFIRGSKIIFCGDAAQTDLQKISERTGIIDFQRILQNMPEFAMVEFGIDDIVRSGLVKSYLINKINLGL